MFNRLPFLLGIMFGGIFLALFYLLGATVYLLIIFIASLKANIANDALGIYYFLMILMILTLAIVIITGIIVQQTWLQRQGQRQLETLFLLEIFFSGLYAIVGGAFLVLTPGGHFEIYIVNGLAIAIALFLLLNFIYLNYAMDNFLEN